MKEVPRGRPLAPPPQLGELRWWMGVSGYQRYGAALGVLALSLLMRFSIEPWIHGLYPFFTAYVAVVASGWLLGVGPALMVLVLAYISHLMLFANPTPPFLPLPRSVAIGTAMYFFNGMLVCMLAQAREEAELRYLRHVKEAKVGKERLRALLDAVPEGVIIVEMPGAMVRELSRVGAEMAGVPREELVGVQVSTLMERFRMFDPSGQVLEGLDRPLARMLATGEAVEDREVILERPDGTRMPVMMNGVAIFDGRKKADDGSPAIVGGVMVYRDITRRKRVMAAMAESAIKYQLLFDQAPFPKWLLDLETLRFLEVNDAAVKCYGYTVEEFRQMTLSDLRAPDEPPSELELHHQTTDHFEGSIQTRHITKDGDVIAVEMTARDIDIHHDSAGPGGAMLVESFDVSDLMRSREEVARKAKELERSNADLEQFAHAAAHDLKEPLRGLVLYSSFLMDDFSRELPEEAKRMVGTISRLASRGAALVDALLDFSQAGRTQLRLGECDLNGVLAEVLEGLSTMLVEQNVVVERQTSLPCVQCDRVQAGRVLTNLITNAVKYNRSDPKRIEIGAMSHEKAGSSPVIYVRDNGIGIKAEHQERIFKMFRRLHGPDAYGGGTGAGLALVEKLVRRHGGDVWVASSPGEGSTFFFTLGPAMPSQDPEGAGPGKVEGSPAGPGADSQGPR